MIPPITPDTERLRAFGIKAIHMAFKDAKGTELVELYHKRDVIKLLQTIQALQEDNQILKEAVALMPDLSVLMSERTLLTAALEKARETLEWYAGQNEAGSGGKAERCLSDIDSVLPPSNPIV